MGALYLTPIYILLKEKNADEQAYKSSLFTELAKILRSSIETFRW